MEKTAQKRTSVHKEHAGNPQIILLELEGAVIPIGFVKETLYKYVKENLHNFLTTHFDDADLQENINELRSQAAADVEKKTEGAVIIPEKSAAKDEVIPAVVKSIEWQLSKGLRNEAAEKIFSKLIQEAYKTEESIKTELFDDVALALKQWSDKRVKSYVLSSRSIEFQKLLLANTKDGDLSELVAGFLHLAGRPKSVKETYVEVSEELKLSPDDVLFATCSVNEATAASAAGLHAYLVVRSDSNKPEESNKGHFPAIQSLTELLREDDAEGIPEKKACRVDPKPAEVSKVHH